MDGAWIECNPCRTQLDSTKASRTVLHTIPMITVSVPLQLHLRAPEGLPPQYDASHMLQACAAAVHVPGPSLASCQPQPQASDAARLERCIGAWCRADSEQPLRPVPPAIWQRLVCHVLAKALPGDRKVALVAGGHDVAGDGVGISHHVGEACKGWAEVAAKCMHLSHSGSRLAEAGYLAGNGDLVLPSTHKLDGSLWIKGYKGNDGDDVSYAYEWQC
jgi:hypothetical protein